MLDARLGGRHAACLPWSALIFVACTTGCSLTLERPQFRATADVARGDGVPGEDATVDDVPRRDVAPQTCAEVSCPAGQACCEADLSCYPTDCDGCCPRRPDVTVVEAGEDAPTLCRSVRCGDDEACCDYTGACYDPRCLSCCRPTDGGWTDGSGGDGPVWTDGPTATDASGADGTTPTDSGTVTRDAGLSCVADVDCGSGQACCSGTCRDLSSDPANCGSCGHICPTGEGCRGGVCQCGSSGRTCASDETCCDGFSGGRVVRACFPSFMCTTR